MKEAKKNNGRMTREEFAEIVTTMTEIPRKEKETQRDYFERLKRYGVNRSRFTLQIVERAIKKDHKDMDAAFNIYKEEMEGTYKKEKHEQDPVEEEQMPGQIEMELVDTKPAEMTNQVKMMRFQAGQIDKLVLKLDHINDTLNMILRAMRKE